jgi:hypothetical protein
MIFALLALVPLIGFKNLPIIFKGVLIVILVGIPILFTILVAVLIISILSGTDGFLIRKVRSLSVKILYPFIILLGNILKLDIDNVRGSFIEINNSLLKSYKNHFTHDKMLLLLPHCLQNSDCKYKITYNIDNCVRCGKCIIKDILEISDEYKISTFIATGGTMARKIIKEKRPEFIIAVACERDLANGIHDSYPLPVYGIPNKRPLGPCFNTIADTSIIRKAIRYFLREK